MGRQEVRTAKGSGEIDQGTDFSLNKQTKVRNLPSVEFRQSTYLMSGEGVIAVGIYGDSINHNREFCDSPAHDQCPNTEVFLECRSEGDKAANVEWDRKITGPEFKGRVENSSNFPTGCILLTRIQQVQVTHHNRLSASKTPLLRRMLVFMMKSFVYRPTSSPRRTDT